MIIIDPGHGGWDPGGGSNNYFKEKDLTLKISDYQNKRFNELGLPSTLTRTSDTTLTPSDRLTRIQNLGATKNDILIRKFGGKLKNYYRVTIGSEKENQVFIDSMKKFV